jgi:hypothetical protein
MYYILTNAIVKIKIVDCGGGGFGRSCWGEEMTLLAALAYLVLIILLYLYILYTPMLL